MANPERERALTGSAEQTAADTAGSGEISLQSLGNLMSGKTLRDIKAVHQGVTADLSEARQVVEQLHQGTSEEVVNALRTILALDHTTRQQEYPALQQFVNRAKPSHYHTPLVRAALQADVPIWLHGEAGSGKSTAGEQAADSLGLPFRSISLGPTTSKSDLMGYRDATGNYHNTAYREVYENGGVFMFDEIDNGSASILTILNSALANGHGEFPDSRVPRHETARFIASANTIGRGATSEYVGRAPIDAATIDRFAFIPMDTDEYLEDALILGTEINRSPLDISAGEVPSPKEWLATVRAHRQALGELGIRAIISQRASLYGVRLAKQGVGKDWLGEMLLYKGMKEHDREKLAENAKRLMPRVQEALDYKTREAAKGKELDESHSESSQETQPKDLEKRDDSEWFTPPENKEITVDRTNTRWLEESLDSSIRRFLPDRYNIDRLDTSDYETSIFVRVCWDLESIHSRELTDRLQTPTITGAVESVFRENNSSTKKRVLVSDIIAAANVEGRYWQRDRGYITQWETEDDDNDNIKMEVHDRIEFVKTHFSQLNDHDVQDYAKQFEACHGFVPGRFTLCNWLRQHPDVGGKQQGSR
jgi:hypothetical protein cdiviTM7_01719